MTVSEAAETAKKHLKALLPELASADVRLEELEVPPYANRWRFTFSATIPTPVGASLTQVLTSRGRISKLIEMDPETGDLISMKNAAA
jgi:hypothetical protein